MRRESINSTDIGRETFTGVLASARAKAFIARRVAMFQWWRVIYESDNKVVVERDFSVL